jgi:hypothetical protein
MAGRRFDNQLPTPKWVGDCAVEKNPPPRWFSPAGFILARRGLTLKAKKLDLRRALKYLHGQQHTYLNSANHSKKHHDRTDHAKTASVRGQKRQPVRYA